MSQEKLRSCRPGLIAGRIFFTGAHPGAIVDALVAERTGSGDPAWVELIAPSMADRLLREVVRPVVDCALGDGATVGWFVVRYRDPDDHLPG
jgi:hypothetical protein